MEFRELSQDNQPPHDNRKTPKEDKTHLESITHPKENLPNNQMAKETEPSEAHTVIKEQHPALLT
ncbi:hypothetical protein U1Q18_048617, partial [Sarracenia purpurea var. burkii]